MIEIYCDFCANKMNILEAHRTSVESSKLTIKTKQDTSYEVWLRAIINWNVGNNGNDHPDMCKDCIINLFTTNLL